MDSKFIIVSVIGLITSIVTVYFTVLFKSKKEKEKEEREAIKSIQDKYITTKIENPKIAESLAQQHAVGILAITMPESSERIKYYVPRGCRVSVGRDESNDIVLNDKSRIVSPKHAIIDSRDDSVWVIDISTNGTSLNEIPLRGEQKPLNSNDVIMIGQYVFEYKAIK